jgi:hypothetical protein
MVSLLYGTRQHFPGLRNEIKETIQQTKVDSLLIYKLINRIEFMLFARYPFLLQPKSL